MQYVIIISNWGENGEDNAVEAVNKDKFDFKILLFPIVGLFTFIIMYIAISLLISKVTYNRRDNMGKILFLCRRNLRRLSRIGYGIKEGETLQEYHERIVNDIPGEILLFLLHYEKVSYSDIIVTNDMLNEVEIASNKLLRFVKSKKFIYRLIVW